MKNLINPLIFIAILSFLAAFASRFTYPLKPLCLSFGYLPRNFLSLANTCLLLAIALGIAQLLKAKKE